MMLPLFDALQVQFDATRRLMRFQWLDPHNYNLRPALEHGLKLVMTHQPHYTLVDFTNLPPVGMADELWLSVHWFPQIARQQLRRVALVSRFEHAHNQTITEAMLWVARHLVRFQLQIFDDVPAALDWLADGNPELVHKLLAEWPSSFVQSKQSTLL